jgi:hypothetical protein
MQQRFIARTGHIPVALQGRFKVCCTARLPLADSFACLSSKAALRR